MTQTSPEPADQTNTNGHNSKSPTNGYVGGHTTPSLEELIPDTNTLESAPSPSPKPQPQPKSVPVWRKLLQGYNNLSLRSKLSLLLMSGAAVPVIAVTQVLVLISQQNAQDTLEKTLRAQQFGFVNDYIFWATGESEWQASSIAKTVEATRINLQNPKLVEANRPLLQTLVSEMMASQDRARPDAYKSLRIITDAQGKTVAQYIQIHEDYPLGTSPKGEEIIHPVSLPTGINLGDVSIIKNALRTERTLTGVELLPGKFLQRLGLDKQATVPLRPQSTQGLSESEQPFAEGTYPDIDQGRAGVVAMAVQPIKVQGKMVGVAVVGTLLNQNHLLSDAFAKIYESSAASVFAQDLQVNTIVPYRDSKTRATGTRIAREVAEVVLNQGQEFFGQTSILGRKYLAAYSPLYDHQKELNPTQAKPVGMTFVGITLEEVESTLGRLQLIGYSIGGGILILAGVVAIPVAGTFSRPIRRLAGFAQQVADGKQGVRLENTSRQDEIGVLSREMNTMATSIEANLEARRQETERVQLFADIAACRVRDSQELESVFNKAVTGAREILKADRVVIYRFYPDWSGYITAESVVTGWPKALNVTIPDTYIRESHGGLYKNGRVRAIDNIYQAGLADCHIKLLERFAIKANLVVPIVQNDQLFGLLFAQHCCGPHAWQQSEINFLTQLAVELGLTITFKEMLEQLQAAFSSQRDFINDASHELRTPIAIIRCYIELLSLDSQEQRETLAIIIDELDRMNRFVNDLLLLCKAEQPNFLNLEIVEISSLTESLYVKASALAARNWCLEALGSGSIIADRQRLTQAVLNLAQNATQHTKDGDMIALGSTSTDGNTYFWVRDTGSGIATADKERIFKRFARGSSRRRSEGAGLGLPIVQAIAEAHLGRVELCSQPGSGSTFTIVIPLEPSHKLGLDETNSHHL